LRLGTTEVTVARGDPILQKAGKFGRLQKQAGIPVMLHMKLLSALIIKICWSLLMEPGLLQLDIKKALKEVKSL
jgi:hypothetical protein